MLCYLFFAFFFKKKTLTSLQLNTRTSLPSIAPNDLTHSVFPVPSRNEFECKTKQKKKQKEIHKIIKSHFVYKSLSYVMYMYSIEYRAYCMVCAICVCNFHFHFHLI